MPGIARTSEVFTIENFEGLNAAVGGSRVGHTMVSDASSGFFGSHAKELVGPMGIEEVLVSTAKRYANALYLWRPPYGGERLMMAAQGSNSFSVLGGYAGGVLDNYIWNPCADGFTAPQYVFNNRFIRGVLEPFGDTLYYCDGQSPLVRIDPFFDTLAVSRNGIDPELLIWEHFENSSGGLKTGIYSYAITTYSRKYGESSIAPGNILSAAIGYEDSFSAITLHQDSIIKASRHSRGFILIRGFNWANTDRWVTHLNIYRTGTDNKVLRLVGRVYRGEESFLDDAPDEALGKPLEMYTTHPPRLKDLASHQNRMWGIDTNDALRYSRMGDPEVWPSPNFVLSPDFSKDDTFTKLSVVHATLFAFMTSNVLRLVGDNPTSYGLELVRQAEGCIAPRSFCTFWGGSIYLGPRGVVIFDGVSSRKMSDALNAAILDNVGMFDITRAVGVIAGDYYLISFTGRKTQPVYTFNGQSGGVYPRDEGQDYESPHDVCYCMNLKTGAWSNPGFAFDLATSDQGKEAYIMTVARAGPGTVKLFKLFPHRPAVSGYVGGFDQAQTHDNDYCPVFEFPHLDFGYPDQNKVVERIEITYEGIGSIQDGGYAARTEETHLVGELSWEPYPGFAQKAALPVSAQALAFTISDIDDATARWGDNWDSPITTYAAPRAFRAVAYLNKATSKSFSLRFISKIPLRLQKIVFHYTLEKSR